MKLDRYSGHDVRRVVFSATLVAMFRAPGIAHAGALGRISDSVGRTSNTLCVNKSRYHGRQGVNLLAIS